MENPSDGKIGEEYSHPADYKRPQQSETIKMKVNNKQAKNIFQSTIPTESYMEAHMGINIKDQILNFPDT